MAENPSTSNDIQNRDENGVPYGIKHVDNKPRVSSLPYTYDIAKDLITDHVAIHKFGANADIDNAEEVIMTQGGMINYLTSAEVPKIKSSSADDDGDPEGAGAWTVTIYGLDANWDIQNETVTLNGQTLVTLANSYIRVFRMIVETCSVPINANVGILTLYQNDGTTSMIEIAAGRGKTQFSAFTVPNGKKLFITHFGITEVNNRRVKARLYTRDNTVTSSPFRIQEETSIINAQSERSFMLPLVFGQKTDVELRGIGDQTNSDCTGYFEGWYE